MPLKATIDETEFEGLDETLRPHYREDGDAYVLDVRGIQDHPKVSSLASSYEHEKERRKELQGKVKEFGDLTPGDVEELQSELSELREGADVDWDAKVNEAVETTKSKLGEKIEEREQRIQSLEGRLHTMLVERTLDQELDRHDIPPHYKPAVRSMLKDREPTVVENDNGELVGVFKQDVDGIPGNHPIPKYLDEWVQTDEAKPFLPPSNKGGGGGTGQQGSGNTRSPDKPYSEMSMEEKQTYLQNKYGDSAQVA